MEVGSNGKLVFARLAQYAGEDGVAFPAQETLAAEAGMNLRTCQRALEELRDHKLIECQRSGMGQSNRYYFLKHEWMIARQSVVTIPAAGVMYDTTKQSGLDTTPVSYKENQLRDSEKESIAKEVIEEWNKTKLTKCSKLTSKRQTHLKARLKDPHWRESWRKALGIICTSPFCCGQNDRGWIADIDWFIRSDEALVKALEGKYSTKKSMSALTPKAPEPVLCKYGEA